MRVRKETSFRFSKQSFEVPRYLLASSAFEEMNEEWNKQRKSNKKLLGTSHC